MRPIPYLPSNTTPYVSPNLRTHTAMKAAMGKAKGCLWRIPRICWHVYRVRQKTVAVCDGVLQWVAVFHVGCSVLQVVFMMNTSNLLACLSRQTGKAVACVAVCCSVLQCVAWCIYDEHLECVGVFIEPDGADSCDVLRCVAACCSVLQGVYAMKVYLQWTPQTCWHVYRDRRRRPWAPWGTPNPLWSGSVVECLAVWCSVLQCAVCVSSLMHATSTLPRMYCCGLQCVAVCCTCVAVCVSSLRHATLHRMCCCGLQWVAVCCSVLQCVASVLRELFGAQRVYFSEDRLHCVALCLLQWFHCGAVRCSALRVCCCVLRDALGASHINLVRVSWTLYLPQKTYHLQKRHHSQKKTSLSKETYHVRSHNMRGITARATSFRERVKHRLLNKKIWQRYGDTSKNLRKAIIHSMRSIPKRAISHKTKVIECLYHKTSFSKSFLCNVLWMLMSI